MKLLNLLHYLPQMRLLNLQLELPQQMLLALLPVELLAELPDLPFVELFVELLVLLFHNLLLNKQCKPFVTTFALHHFELHRVRILASGHRMIQMRFR
jgi:hypothetical protein